MMQKNYKRILKQVQFHYSDGSIEILKKHANDWIEEINNIVVLNQIRTGYQFPEFEWSVKKKNGVSKTK